MLPNIQEHNVNHTWPDQKFPSPLREGPLDKQPSSSRRAQCPLTPGEWIPFPCQTDLFKQANHILPKAPGNTPTSYHCQPATHSLFCPSIPGRNQWGLWCPLLGETPVRAIGHICPVSGVRCLAIPRYRGGGENPSLTNKVKKGRLEQFTFTSWGIFVMVALKYFSDNSNICHVGWHLLIPSPTQVETLGFF